LIESRRPPSPDNELLGLGQVGDHLAVQVQAVSATVLPPFAMPASCGSSQPPLLKSLERRDPAAHDNHLIPV
jgi:hypothetical protein